MSFQNYFDTLLEKAQFESLNVEIFTKQKDLLKKIFTCSPYLRELILKDTALASSLLSTPIHVVKENILKGFENVSFKDDDDYEIMRFLRRLKNQMALCVALADLTKEWGLEEITGTLSLFADQAIHIALLHAYQKFSATRDLTIPLQDSGLFVLGLGKLGAFELNYSSDVDLIILFDETKLDLGLATGQFFNRIAKHFIFLLSEHTADGYVFRTDMRLRPDALATPIALSCAAAETYYTSLGQNWERAALIKARTVAGDKDSGLQFLNFIQPFIWRKYLDFAAIDEIRLLRHQMLNRFEIHDPNPGFNLKLGHGGIRDLEFFVQAQLLIWGGRYPQARVSKTLEGLKALCSIHLLNEEEQKDLTEAYIFLRTLEHRLQMVHDQQTHSFPQDKTELKKTAVFCGYPSVNALFDAVQTTTSKVSKYVQKLNPQTPLHAVNFENMFNTYALEEMGFENAELVLERIRTWLNGTYKATYHERARSILEKLLPKLLSTFSKLSNPNQGFWAFDDFLNHLPAGLTTFSLFEAKPELFEDLMLILGSNTLLADHLKNTPSLLDILVSPSFLGNTNTQLQESFNAVLSQARDFEDVLALSRKWLYEQKFLISLGVYKGTLQNPHEKLTFIAEIIIHCVFEKLYEDYQKQYSQPNHSEGFAILGLGSLGACQMNINSDLDLIFLFDDSSVNNAEASHYFLRLAQRFLTALTTQMRDGLLYEIDMRLRPSGHSGPLINSLASFELYHKDNAWVWEHFALTKARVIYASDSFRQKIDPIMTQILKRPRSLNTIVREISNLRKASHPLKNILDSFEWAKGGFYEFSCLIAYLKLRYAAHFPELLTPYLSSFFDHLRKNEIIQESLIHHLEEVSHLFIHLKSCLSLLKANSADSFQAAVLQNPFLKKRFPVALLEDKCQFIHNLYEQWIEWPAEKLPPMQYPYGELS
jgi:[glutamine synthetase] adenylyltransferase / [glutamine synthetase]-adenylyl-L-tyrosine phosphorylase